jgi:hypothetical protein
MGPALINSASSVSPRILVIEDDQAVACSLHDGLTMDGYKVGLCCISHFP